MKLTTIDGGMIPNAVPLPVLEFVTVCVWVALPVPNVVEWVWPTDEPPVTGVPELLAVSESIIPTCAPVVPMGVP